MSNHRGGKISLCGHSKKSRQKQFSGYPRSAAVLTSCSFPVHMPPSALCPYKAPGQIGGGGEVDWKQRGGRQDGRWRGGKSGCGRGHGARRRNFPSHRKSPPGGPGPGITKPRSLPKTRRAIPIARTHACLLHTHTHESHPSLPPLHHPCIPPSPTGATAAFLPLLGMPLEVCPSARRGEQRRSQRIPFSAVPTMPNTRPRRRRRRSREY